MIMHSVAYMPFHTYAFYAPGKGRGYMSPNLRLCALFAMWRPGERERDRGGGCTCWYC